MQDYFVVRISVNADRSDEFQSETKKIIIYENKLDRLAHEIWISRAATTCLYQDDLR